MESRNSGKRLCTWATWDVFQECKVGLMLARRIHCIHAMTHQSHPRGCRRSWDQSNILSKQTLSTHAMERNALSLVPPSYITARGGGTDALPARKAVTQGTAHSHFPPALRGTYPSAGRHGPQQQTHAAGRSPPVPACRFLLYRT